MRQTIATLLLAGFAIGFAPAQPAQAGPNMAWCYQLYARYNQCQREQQAMNRWGGGGWDGGYGGGGYGDGYGGGWDDEESHYRRHHHAQRSYSKGVECTHWLAALQVNHCM